jgi:hypothetical protein
MPGRRKTLSFGKPAGIPAEFSGHGSATAPRTLLCAGISTVGTAFFALLALPPYAAFAQSEATPPNAGAEAEQTDVLKFNGTGWNPATNARFLARFEKYLNTPEESSEAEQGHRKILLQIAGLLEPRSLNSNSLSNAFRLLTRATYYPGDSRLSDTLANGIYAIWQTKRNTRHLQEANRVLDEERNALLKNMGTASKGGADGRAGGAIQQAGRAGSILEKGSRMAANEALSQLSEIQAKVAYQGLLVQLFMQKRFHHLLIGTRFYRAIFDDGDSRLNLANAAPNPLGERSGSPPSVAVLETLALEAIRDVQTAVTAFHQHLEKQELRGATEKLREALMVGEFLPELRTIPLERKRVVLAYFQKSMRLQSALEARDYALVSELLEGEQGLQKTAADFDSAPALGALQGARNAAGLCLQKARAALQEGDKAGFEKSLSDAAQIWPNNPDLLALAASGFRQSDEAAMVLREFEELVSQKNFRRICEQAARFQAGLLPAPPEKKARLREILERGQSVEGALAMAAKLNEEGNPAGAWEKVHVLSKSLPDEARLTSAAAEYAIRASAFVEAVQKAQKLREEAQAAPSLAWFLRAQKLFPASVLVRESMEPLCATLLEQQRN